MDDPLYTPKSDFLWLAGNGDVPLGQTPEGEANLTRVIRFTEDAEKSNRDWATMILAMQEADTPQIRDALLRAADDEDCDVRAEALEGLSNRDKALALPLVQRELAKPQVGYGVFIAAAILADNSLVQLLQPFDTDTEASWVDDAVRNAIKACKSGQSFPAA